MPGRTLAGLLILLAGIGLPQASLAQMGHLFGSPEGTYCKVKKNDVISARTSLPLEASSLYARQMTMRRLASLARSKGFSAFVVTQESCGTLLINRLPSSRVCNISARMENTDTPHSAGDAGKWFSVEAVLRDTQANAASYPITQGLLNRGNKCVID